eukprot:2174795-Pyramimonas_sp.AAC.1
MVPTRGNVSIGAPSDTAQSEQPCAASARGPTHRTFPRRQDDPRKRGPNCTVCPDKPITTYVWNFRALGLSGPPWIEYRVVLRALLEAS